MVAQRVRDYELVVVLSPEATEEEVTAAVERVEKAITDRGGSVTEREIWGLRRLAYPVRKFAEGNYVLIRFTLGADEVLDFKRTLNASEDVMISLVTRL